MGNSADIASQAAQPSIDIGLIEGSCRQADLLVRTWFEDELVIVAATSNPLAGKGTVTLQDLNGAPWLIREDGSGTAEEVLQWLLPYLGDLGSAQRIGSSETIKRMGISGVGISAFPIGW